MKARTHTVRWLLAAVLAIAAPVSLAAQQGGEPQSPRPRGDGGRPPERRGQFRPPPGPKAGDWLRKYQRLAPQEQEKALANDPEFQRLPPEHQEKLRERLRWFNQLPQEQRDRILNRMEKFDQMSPEQRQQWMHFHGMLKRLPPERQKALHQAYRRLRQMTPEDRTRTLESDQFRQMFAPHEQEMLRGMLESGPPEDF